ncbi:NUDIX hydrolase [Frankia sp. AgB1.9]|uniref:NUDIX hydrolase n=1 Tax=unclassified Frankia TaxID=2632575 RepID=UPI001931FECE|nr:MULTISPECIES: NUDIX hydrolase [unclassified Frankia]MBL7494537.1 NUDIX hydrolase [Frankia sp. AgW1.1]MBL7550120.1 NUDIX hydrolase [Frankia sp. AgB1.9]MBL7621137.1 NUDIX hydrolase [Frankia sp. AgB1.8]
MNSLIAASVRNYLGQHPAEETALAPLLELVEQPAPVTSRSTTPGHVTCGALVVNEDGKILQIHHKTLNRWLLPGGHMEPGDATPLVAAIRELAEETGIEASQVIPIGGDPVDIDAHEIPANPGKGEPTHVHYDFRFTMRIAAREGLHRVALQLDEVMDYRWVEASGLAGRLAAKVPTFLETQHQAWT